MSKLLIPVSRAKTAYGLLSEVAKVIEQEPLRYDQGCYIDTNALEHPQQPACGTVGCVAGWVCALKKKPLEWLTVGHEAATILGLHSLQRYELFNGDAAGLSPAQTVKHAKAGIRHIKRFQKKYEQQLKAKKV